MSMLSVVERLCMPLEAPENGHIAGKDRHIGATVIYTCDLHYNINGPSNRTCLSEGIWSDQHPSCQGDKKHKGPSCQR